MKNKCHLTETGQRDSFGNLINMVICYCGTTSCTHGLTTTAHDLPKDYENIKEINYLNTNIHSCCGLCGKPESHNIEHECKSKQAWEKKLEKELEYVATYASPERRIELLSFLKIQFNEALITQHNALLQEVMEKLRIDFRIKMLAHVEDREDVKLTHMPEFQAGQVLILSEVETLLESMKK